MLLNIFNIYIAIPFSYNRTQSLIFRYEKIAAFYYKSKYIKVVGFGFFLGGGVSL